MTNAELLTAIEAVARVGIAGHSWPTAAGPYVDKLRLIVELAGQRNEEPTERPTP